MLYVFQTKDSPTLSNQMPQLYPNIVVPVPFNNPNSNANPSTQYPVPYNTYLQMLASLMQQGYPPQMLGFPPSFNPLTLNSPQTPLPTYQMNQVQSPPQPNLMLQTPANIPNTSTQPNLNLDNDMLILPSSEQKGNSNDDLPQL